MSKVNDNLFDIDGLPLPPNPFVVIARTLWNQHVTDVLVQGAQQILEQHGVRSQVIDVPGALELPQIVDAYHAKHPEGVHAYIALGCIMKGETPHFENVCQSTFYGLMHLNATIQIPVINAVLTVHDQMEADERTGGRHGHKGKEAAASAIRMISLNYTI